jgi:hypothetical protein
MLWVLKSYYTLKISKIHKNIFLYSLVWKMIFTAALSYLFKYYFDYITDPQAVFAQAKKVADHIVLHPDKTIEMLFFDKAPNIDYSSQNRTFFLIKAVAILNFFTNSNYWLNSYWFSLICFLCTWQLAVVVHKHHRPVFPAYAISFLFVPSVVFWSSGLLKETLAFAALCVLVRQLILFLQGRISLWPALLAAYVLFKIKFYVLGAFLLVALPSVVVFLAQKKRALHFKTKAVLFLGSLAFIFLIFNTFSNFYFHATLPDLVYYNHVMMLESNNVDYVFSELKEGQMTSFYPYILEALWQGLFKPLPYDADSLLLAFAALENTLCLVLGCYLFYCIVLKKMSFSAWQLAVLLYVLMCAVCFGFSAPNWGTLARYKIVYSPFLYTILLWTVIQNATIKRIFARFNPFKLT